VRAGNEYLKKLKTTINMKKYLCLLIMCLPLLTMAQETTGVKWTTGLTWEQVKQKAKAENKYVFLDIYATWCGPCKEMDANVYTNDSVGNYFNEKFISVKVQMDQTKKDDEQIKKWYDDALAISKQYDIRSFPSFLFLNPQGIATDLQIGFQNASELIRIAQSSIAPGRVYTTRPEAFKNFVTEYHKGNINYKELPSMILLASRFDTALKRELMGPYKEYLAKLDPKERYIEENVVFWSSLNLSSKSQFFQYFLKDANEIDKVMGRKGYSLDVIDKTIQLELVVPFFYEQTKNPNLPMSGMYLTGLKPDSSEADWKKLERMIRQKFDKSTTKRNVLAARIEWYLRHANEAAYLKYLLVHLEKYPSNNAYKYRPINSAAWTAFLSVTNKEELNEHIKRMGKLLELYPNVEYYVDTYANLLYKVGRKQEAIEWEEKAVKLNVSGFKGYSLAVEQMRKGEPSNGVTPLVNYKIQMASKYEN